MLTLQFLPYSEIESLGSEQRINKLLNLVKEDKIVLMEGRLRLNEETKLIEATMEKINNSFKGVEICTVYPARRDRKLGSKFKKELLKLLLGYQAGITIIGPATIVKEIKRDPNRILLLTHELKTRRRRNSK